MHGERLYVVDAVPTGQPRPMRTYRLPDGKPLARTTLQIPDEVTGVLPVGDTTLIQTTIGERPAVVAMDNATGLSPWWQFGSVRGVSAAAGEVLDPATGRVRADLGGWREIPGPDDGLTYLVHPGPSTSLFGRFDPATISVRIVGATDQAFGHRDRGAGAVVCHLTAGPVAVWRLD